MTPGLFEETRGHLPLGQGAVLLSGFALLMEVPLLH